MKERAKDIIGEAVASPISALHRTAAHALESLPQLQVLGAPDQRFQAVLECLFIGIQDCRIDKAPLNQEKPLCKPTHGSM
jgi:hypothetical protein